MVQADARVSVHCGQCGDPAVVGGVPAYWPTEAATWEAVASQGWYVRENGQVWCPACGPVLTCEADEGHDFTPWCPDSIRSDAQYRECTRCPLGESRPIPEASR